MPNWKDEIKAGLVGLSDNVDAISPTGKEFRELIALLQDLVDHVPEPIPEPDTVKSTDWFSNWKE